MGSDRWKNSPPLISLPPETLKNKGNYLTKLFNSSRWKREPVLLGLSTELLEDHAKHLTQLLAGEQWKSQPTLLTQSPEILKDKANNLTKIFNSDRWKTAPLLLSLSQETAIKYATDYTRHFKSNNWMERPSLLTVSPRTFNASLKMLEGMGITPETHGKAVLLLLGTTTGLKREKAELIRKEILGHKNVYIFSKKIPLEEYIKFRTKLTPEQKEAEKKEIEEFAEFLQAHPNLLVKSKDNIIQWGEKHGYIK